MSNTTHHQELLAAVRERVTLGYTDDAIKTELHDAGYDDAAVADILTVVHADQAESMTSPESTGQLIGYGALVQGAFHLLKSQRALFLRAARDVVILLLIGVFLSGAALVVSGVDLTALPHLNSQSWLAGAAGLGLIAAFVLISLLWLVGVNVVIFSLIRSLIHRTDPTYSYARNVRWSLRHVLAIIWVGILASLATQFGYAILVLPGIALTFYLLFANYYLATGTVTGASALVASIELVFNRWWSVLARMVVVGLVGVSVAALVALLVFVLNLGLVAVDVLFGIVASVVGLISLVVGLFAYQLSATVLLFESLQQTKRVQFTESRRSQVRIGLLIAAGLGLVVAVMQQNIPTKQNLFDPFSSAQSEARTAMLEAELLLLATNAEMYYASTGGSYEGVCPELQASITGEDRLDCIDRADRWAASIETADRGAYCIDSEQRSVVAGRLDAAAATCRAMPEIVDTDTKTADLKNWAQQLRQQGQE